MLRKRTQSRSYAIQMLYTSFIMDENAENVISDYYMEYANEKEDILEFAKKIFIKAYNDKDEDRRLISSVLSNGCSIERIDVLEMCILHLGISELFTKEVPYYAVISDYVALAGAYLGSKPASFINKILDEIKNKFIVELENDRKAYSKY